MKTTLGKLVLGVVGAGALLVSPGFAAAQQGECAGGLCGTPEQTGGGCGCGCGCSILINQSDLGDTYQYSDDFDNDGMEDDFDNCPFMANSEQTDTDGDGMGNSCDNCRSASNPSQADADGDRLGDTCDDDADGDTLPNLTDNCPLFPNNGLQEDVDSDGLGNLCDDDDDNDTVTDINDNCPLVANPAQGLGDPAEFGTRCKSDADSDGIPDSFDNCPSVSGQDTTDGDRDGIGNLCDRDWDNDGVGNDLDNCRNSLNPTQVDGDRDGMGDLCDDKFCFTIDNPGDASRCLDPESPLFVRPGKDESIKTGEPLRLRLFANRANTAIRYTWAVEKGGRGAQVQNPRGTVTYSTPYEYTYLKDRTPMFVATEPGDYVVRLESELVFDDVKGFPKKTDVQTFNVKVSGNALLPGLPVLGGDCSQTGNGGFLAMMGMLALAIRRRR